MMMGRTAKNSGKTTKRFHTSALLRVGSILALQFWLAITFVVALIAMFGQTPVPLTMIAGLLLFDLLFLAATLHYHHRRFVVDEEGIVITSAVSFHHFPWDEVKSVQSEVGFLPGYRLATRGGVFGFSGVEMPGHRELYAWVRRKAGSVAQPSSPQQPDIMHAASPVLKTAHKPKRRRRNRRR